MKWRHDYVTITSRWRHDDVLFTIIIFQWSIGIFHVTIHLNTLPGSKWVGNFLLMMTHCRWRMTKYESFGTLADVIMIVFNPIFVTVVHSSSEGAIIFVLIRSLDPLWR